MPRTDPHWSYGALGVGCAKMRLISFAKEISSGWVLNLVVNKTPFDLNGPEIDSTGCVCVNCKPWSVERPRKNSTKTELRKHFLLRPSI